MKPTSSSDSVSGQRSGVWLMLLLILVILSALFRYNYLPGFTQFSNDGPIGNLHTEAHKPIKEFFGGWQDLNSVGIPEPAWPGISWCLLWLLGPVAYSKLYAPVGLLLLGLGAWTFFRTMRFAPTACILGGLAAMLNSGFFSVACWGVVAHTNTIAMTFFAMAALVSARNAEPTIQRWVRIALAGLAVGMGVAEGADLGAIFSVYVAAFAMFQALNSEGTSISRLRTGAIRVVVVALFAAFLAAQPISVLIGFAIKGVSGTRQDAQSKLAQWDFATQTSLPKSEALCLLIPGLFGYRLDTPTDMSTFESKYQGGAYWGQAGRDPIWDRWVEGGKKGPQPLVLMRYTGGGNYTGVLVVLVAVWASLQSFRKEKSVFSLMHRKWIWFWTSVVIVSLLLAFGRYAPFYHLFYALPYASAIRNPSKFTHGVNLALVVLFGFGVHGLCRQYLDAAGSGVFSLKGHFKNWWAKVAGFDRKWVIGCAVAFIAGIIGWLVYSSSRPSIEEYIASVAGGSMTGDTPQAIAAFSIREVGWFVLFFFLAAALLVFVLSGWFAGGRRAKLGGTLLGLLLVVDLGRANQPWIIVWDYEMKYASNPIIDFLREKPYEHRVAKMPDWLFKVFQIDDRLKSFEGYFQGFYGGEWAQHVMLYYNVQSLDIVQMSRMPDDILAYRMAFVATTSPQELCRMATRQWELTNTRYLLGSAPMIELLNRFFDPVQHRFRIVERFDFAGKPGITQPTRPVEQTAVLSPTNGMFALFEFTGALPRAKLYANWEVSTNAEATLRRLTSAEFDPHKAVIVSEPIALPTAANATNANPGTVEFSHYEPNHIILKANANAPSVLLLNDRFEENWKAMVDGKPATLLHGNFIMRAVQLEPGLHTVDYRYARPVKLFYVTSFAIVFGFVLLGFIAISNRRKETPEPQPDAKTAPAPAKK